MNLKTNYLGLELRNPLVASASPMCKELDLLKKMEDAGAGAVVLHSLFEEQINLEANALDDFLWQGTDVGAESSTVFADLPRYQIGPEAYLEHIRKAKAALKIPVIASLNGVSAGGWIRYAQMMEAVGADALELNIYFLPTDTDLPASFIERYYTELVATLSSTVRIPVAVKLAPFFSNVANMAKLLEKSGASGLVLFNRFYQPDFDLDNLEVVPSLTLSRREELNLRLHWAAILFGRVNADVAITGGVHTAEDVVKCMMAGSKVACMTSALLENGPQHFSTVKRDLIEWMDKHEYASIEQMQGALSHRNVANAAAFERNNYLKVLSSYVLATPANAGR
jgi:dihydroorotate dehydrogenase (fumarate)